MADKQLKKLTESDLKRFQNWASTSEGQKAILQSLRDAFNEASKSASYLQEAQKIDASTLVEPVTV